MVDLLKQLEDAAGNEVPAERVCSGKVCRGSEKVATTYDRRLVGGLAVHGGDRM